MTLHRPVCDLLGCAHPVMLMLAGTGGVARGERAVAVARAGGFSFLDMLGEPPELISAELAYVRGRTGRNFGLTLTPAATPPALLEAQVQLCIELRVPVVGLFGDLAASLLARLRAAAIVVICQVGSVAEALAAEAAGAGTIIAQGCVAGGHVRGEIPLHTLLPEAAARLRVPLLAAGGLASGADVATAMALGAQGAVLGTAMLATWPGDLSGITSSLRAIVVDVAERLGAGGAPLAEPAGFASPACAAREMDDAYMGFAPREELLAALNELLEAERAGARVALQTIAQARSSVLQELLHRIHRDEARWCGALTGAVLALGGKPSGQTGAFHEKAMAIPDLPQRLVFLNKGQAWVVRKLVALLPRVRAEEIHHDLSAMLAAHEESIRRVEAIEGI